MGGGAGSDRWSSNSKSDKGFKAMLNTTHTCKIELAFNDIRKKFGHKGTLFNVANFLDYFHMALATFSNQYFCMGGYRDPEIPNASNPGIRD